MTELENAIEFEEFNTIDEYKKIPSKYLGFARSPEMISYLIDRHQVRFSISSYFKAVDDCKNKVAECLLGYIIPIDSHNEFVGDTDLLIFLKINQKNSFADTVFHMARFEFFLKMLRHRAEVKPSDIKYAVMQGDLGLLREIVRAGNYRLTNKSVEVALREGHLKMADYIKDHMT